MPHKIYNDILDHKDTERSLWPQNIALAWVIFAREKSQNGSKTLVNNSNIHNRYDNPDR